MMVLRRQKIAEEHSVPGEDLHGNAPAEDLRQGRRSEMNGLADDEPVQIAKWDLAQKFLTLRGWVPAVDFGPLSGQMDPAVWLIDDGGRHLARRCMIYDLGIDGRLQLEHLDFRQRVLTHDSLNPTIEQGRVADGLVQLFLAPRPVLLERAFLCFQVVAQRLERFDHSFYVLTELGPSQILIELFHLGL